MTQYVNLLTQILDRLIFPIFFKQFFFTTVDEVSDNFKDLLPFFFHTIDAQHNFLTDFFVFEVGGRVEL